MIEREDGVAENFTDLEGGGNSNLYLSISHFTPVLNCIFCLWVIFVEKYEKYFLPLEAACESRYPRLMEIALDAFHFLIGYIRYDLNIFFLFILKKSFWNVIYRARLSTGEEVCQCFRFRCNSGEYGEHKSYVQQTCQYIQWYIWWFNYFEPCTHGTEQ